MTDFDTKADAGGIIVVAEAGSSSSGWTKACRANPNDATIIAQQSNESCNDFAHRTTARLARLTATGWTARVAVLALAAASADRDFRTRPLIARALLATLDGGGDGTLLLMASKAVPPAARHSLFGLAQALTESPAGTSLAIRVLFGDEPTSRRGPIAVRPLAYATPPTGLRRMRVA